MDSQIMIKSMICYNNFIMIKYMKHIVQNIIYSLLIVLLLYVFIVHMKIIEGNTTEKSGVSNTNIMDNIYILEKKINKIMRKMRA